MTLSLVSSEVLSPVESMTSRTVYNIHRNVASRKPNSCKLKFWPFYTFLIGTMRPSVPRNRDSSVHKTPRSAEQISEASTGGRIECLLSSRDLKFRFPYTLGYGRRPRSRYEQIKRPTRLRTGKVAGGKSVKTHLLDTHDTVLDDLLFR